MRMLKTLFLLFLLIFSIFSLEHPSEYVRAANDTESTTVWLSVGESFEYYYFNITLVDISVYGDVIMIEVEGIQGEKSTTVEINSTKDIFKDGTLTIILTDTNVVMGGTSSAQIIVSVNLKNLAELAYGMFRDTLNDENTLNVLPTSVVQEYQQKLSIVEEYLRVGDYVNSIDLSKKSIEELRELVPKAKDAISAINMAKAAILDPSTVTKGCEVPQSIIDEAKIKLQDAQNAFESGEFYIAEQYANLSYEIIYNACNACRDYPQKKGEVEKFLNNLSSIEIGIPLDSVWSIIRKAEEEYSAGNCISAFNYLTKATNLATQVWTRWNETKACKLELISKINEYRDRYSFTYEEFKITIKLDTILDEIQEEIDKQMKRGNFQTAVYNCNKLNDQVDAKKRAFLESWQEMNRTINTLNELSLQGYILTEAQVEFRSAMKLFEEGNYTEAKYLFIKARGTALSTKEEADKAKELENKTLSCIAQLEAKGINATRLFGEEINNAKVLYKFGNYTDSYYLWGTIYSRCTNPEISNAIQCKAQLLQKVEEMKANGIPLPESFKKELELTNVEISSGNITTALKLCSKTLKELTQFDNEFKKIKSEVEITEKFLELNEGNINYMLSLLGIPQLQNSSETLKVLLQKTRKSLDRGNWEEARMFATQLQSLRDDIDQDGYPNSSDPVPYIPNYYIFSLVIALALLIAQTLR